MGRIVSKNEANVPVTAPIREAEETLGQNLPCPQNSHFPLLHCRGLVRHSLSRDLQQTLVMVKENRDLTKRVYTLRKRGPSERAGALTKSNPT